MGHRAPSAGAAAIRRAVAPASIAASPAKAPRADFLYAAIVMLITICCLAIELMAPAEWQPHAAWLLLAPAGGLVVAGIPALVVAGRSRRTETMAREKDELIGLLLRDYTGERSDWVWSCDAEGRLRGVSQKFALHAGRSAGSLEGMPLVSLLVEPRGDGVSEGVTVSMRQRQPFHDVVAEIKADGECRWRMAGRPVFQDGRFAGYVGTASSITSEARAGETMAYLAYNDGLTGLANRVQFQRRLAECAARFDRYGTAFTLLLLDLDKFKAVNDTLGHQAGDRLLIEVGKRLGGQMRKADLVARLGGDEFALLLPDEANPANVASLATRLIRQICLPFPIDGKELSIGVSIGIAIAPINGTEAGQLVRNADVALYRAKAEGGDSYCFFEAGMDAEAHEQHELETELKEALERGELVFHYQPLISPADGRVLGLEAMIRWNHPTRGLMQPVEFMPLAEHAGLNDRIGEWKIFEACRALAQLPGHLTVAVNVSSGHARSAEFAAVVERALERTKVAAQRLEIEVTESLLIENPGDAIDNLARLKELGTRICMDHFGTGYSSLSCLTQFPFDRLKIDGSLVAASSDEAQARRTVRAVMALAKATDIAVACAGVATAGQVEFLTEAGATVLQGEYFAKPMPMDEALLVTGVGAAVTSAADRQSVRAVG